MSAEVFHRLGAALGVVLALGWLLRWIETVRRERRVHRRLARLLAPELERERAPVGRWLGARGTVRRWLPVAGAVSAGWVLVGGGAGVVVGLVAGFGLWRWRLRRSACGPAAEDVDAAEAARQLPLAADLLAACIAAGAGPVIAAQAVGEALAGPVGERLARGAAEVRLGGEPAEAWRRLASIPGAGPLATLLERADESGVPAAGPVARLAADTRADWGRSATERARRAAVMVTAPVGLCFLPAFIAIGVLPVVIGLADGLLGGGGG
ncbi:type II secretion system F family protein [Streptomyces sp. NBC_00576]|uniref:type II secretion system F family protein n=1 Tax=Streptomyces sp. NBC_00576 TaxID=2903665 RepID=UPI002E811FB9|nr:type II secretion system F family protein [Streptomyces sp. NBC_00576]WUB73389.1 type II secretion system F family protein [Streptomyces sp. NBC_00576]